LDRGKVLTCELITTLIKGIYYYEDYATIFALLLGWIWGSEENKGKAATL
jgi:hypothetical protein